jgi:hypothetical protein
MPPTSTAEDAGVLWLATLQRMLGRASHDVKDSLNGVSVNLEVIRSRAGTPGAPAATLVQFADAAGQQLERLTTLLDAVLALGRSEREPADVGVVLRRVATLCGASAAGGEAAVEVQMEGVDAAPTRVRGDAVRLAIAAPLLDVVTHTERSGAAPPVRCTLSAARATIVVTIRAPGRRVAMPEAVAEAVRAAGVHWTDGEQAGDDLLLAFPRA